MADRHLAAPSGRTVGRGTRTALAASLAAVALLAQGGSARADAVGKVCAARYEKSQYLQRDGKLHDARVEALACAASSCPTFMQQACQKQLADLDSAQPTIVLGAQDAAGADLVDVSVTVDGQPFQQQLGATPAPIDPGEHTFHFARADGTAVEQHTLVRIGEKNRVIRVVFAAPHGAVAAAPTQPVSGEPPGSIWPSVIVGAVGVAAIGASIGVGVVAKNDLSNLRSTCAPGCSPSAVSDATTKGVVSDVLLGVGVAAVGVAAVLFFTRKSGHEAPPVAWHIVPSTAGIGLAF